jgi:hypothetical protein
MIPTRWAIDGFLQILGGEEDVAQLLVEVAHLVPDLDPADRPRPVVGSSRNRTSGLWTRAAAVEAALHAAQ